MKVSIIVPTFNRAEMLKETLDSIFKQTIQDFEIIIVDNCSVDDTGSIVKSYKDQRIKYFKNQNNGILAINMNYGMKKAKGKYIAFCDDDDLWMPDKLEKQLVEFEKDEKIGLVCTNGMNFNENGNYGLVHKNSLDDNEFKFESLILRNPIINSSILIKKSVIDDVGMMDEEPEIFGSEEYSLWIRTAKKYKIRYIDLPLMKYRTHPEVYRNEEAESIHTNEHIYRKLLNNEIIDHKLFLKVMMLSKIKYIKAKIVRLLNDKKIN